MGYSPTIAGRLYGFGNVAFALFATSMIYLAAWLADGLERRRRRAAAAGVVVALGVAALALDGLPELGSDFGGVIAIAAGFGVLLLGVLELRLSVLRLAALVGFGLLVVIGISVIDWLRPSEERSHLGRFVQQVADGELLAVIGRKLGNNLDILFSSVLGLLVPFAVLFLALVLMRPSGRTTSVLRQAYQRAPLLRPALSAWLVAMVVGFAVNDSGIAIPAVGIMLTLPLLISLSVRVLAEPELIPAGPPAASGD
jgi:tetrahydromethanopterin S-methyltransferase subunit G